MRECGGDWYNSREKALRQAFSREGISGFSVRFRKAVVWEMVCTMARQDREVMIDRRARERLRE